MEKESFSKTSADIARAVPCDAGTVRLYADTALVESHRLANGMRLFKPSAAARVREIREERLARRGGPRKKKAG